MNIKQEEKINDLEKKNIEYKEREKAGKILWMDGSFVKGTIVTGGSIFIFQFNPAAGVLVYTVSSVIWGRE